MFTFVVASFRETHCQVIDASLIVFYVRLLLSLVSLITTFILEYISKLFETEFSLEILPFKSFYFSLFPFVLFLRRKDVKE